MFPASESVLEMIGPYRLCNRLGQGGMGTVYLAERVKDFTQRVAIKIVDQPGAATGENSEERVLVSLNHAAIVRLIDWGETARSQRYLVMEYVDGVPLDLFCERHGLSENGRVKLLLQVADAVTHAHQRLVVHCDLKPSNILVDSAGQVKLLDFGVAQLLGLGLRRERAEGGTGYTEPFASPEQIAGEPLNITTDVYALGMIAKQLLLAGRKTHPDLAAIVRRSTEAQPGLRYRSMEAFADDLRCFLEGRLVRARPGGAWLQLRSWVFRHLGWAAVIVSLSFITFSSGTIFVKEALNTARERRDAQMHLHELVQMTGDLDGALYNSAVSLPHSDAARAILAERTRTTLRRLAEDDGGDPVLSLQIARQYEQAAGLELKSPQRTAAQYERAREYLQNGLVVLAKIPASAPAFSEVRREQAALTSQLLALSRP